MTAAMTELAVSPVTGATGLTSPAVTEPSDQASSARTTSSWRTSRSAVRNGARSGRRSWRQETASAATEAWMLLGYRHGR